MIGMFNVRNAKKLDSEIQMSQDPLNQLESNFLCIIFHPRLVIGIAVEHLLLKRTLTILNSFSAKSGHFNRNQSPVKTIWQENIQIGVQIWRTFGAKMTVDDMPCPTVKCWSQGLSASRACIGWVLRWFPLMVVVKSIFCCTLCSLQTGGFVFNMNHIVIYTRHFITNKNFIYRSS